MEGQVVEPVKGRLDGLALSNTISIGMAVPISTLQLSFALAVGGIGTVQGLCIAVERVMSIHVRVLAGEIRLVEVVDVGHITSSQARLDHDGSIRANQHGDAASASSRSSIALGIEGNIASHHNALASVPAGRLHPVDRVDQGVGASIAGIEGINSLDVVVLAKELHQHRLDRLGLVEDRLCADLETANVVDVDAVVLDQF